MQLYANFIKKYHCFYGVFWISQGDSKSRRIFQLGISGHIAVSGCSSVAWPVFSFVRGCTFDCIIWSKGCTQRCVAGARARRARRGTADV